MADFKTIKDLINEHVVTNGQGLIDAVLLRGILIGMLDAVGLNLDDKVDTEEGKSLILDTLITKLSNMPTITGFNAQTNHITIGGKEYELTPYVPIPDYYVGYFNDGGWSSNTDFANLTGDQLARMASLYYKNESHSVTRTIVAADIQASDPDNRREILFVMWRDGSAPVSGTMNLGLGIEQLSAGDIDGTAAEPKFKTSSHDIVKIDGVDYNVSGLRAKFEIGNSVTFNF